MSDKVTSKGGRYVKVEVAPRWVCRGLIKRGFGSFSKHYGLAAGLLEAEIITRRQIRTVNADKDTHLGSQKGGRWESR